MDLSVRLLANVTLAACRAALCACLFLTLSPAKAANALFDHAVDDYKAGKYGEALGHFYELNKKNGKDTLTHYYMGLCYQCLNQVARAQMEYSWVYYYGKDNTLRYNAQTALTTLAKYQSHRTYEGQGNNFDRGAQSQAFAYTQGSEEPATPT